MIHRSRLFWFGLLGLLFLLWGWADWRPSRSLEAKLGRMQLTVGNWAGTVRFAWQTEPVGAPGFTIAGQTGTRAPDYIRLFPPALAHSQFTYAPSRGGGRFTTLSIAYWFLILVYLPLWLVALTKWQRRKARLLNDATAAGTVFHQT